MNIKILRIHEDHVTTTILTFVLLNGLLVLVSPYFRNRWKKYQKEELTVFLK